MFFHSTMEDIQNQPDERNIPIDRVGVKRLSYPITVLDKFRGRQETVAEIEMTVDLPHRFRGTHMSRFVEILEKHRSEITLFTIGKILREIRKALNARCASMSADFPYFIEKTAPVSGAKSLMRYDCRFSGTFSKSEDFVLTVTVPVTTLCPCSKAISKRSAHNQRSLVTVSAKFAKFLWIEDLVRMVEESASAEVFTLLKRIDEKFLTERAYGRPRFAEDLVREVAQRLEQTTEVVWFSVAVESIESIHAHSAYAFLKREKVSQTKLSQDKKKTPLPFNSNT